ncbi:hypothetical protein HK102_007655 [Quaeritorhiza haematococci]|nr:hypothetical protein HK102_007655 [Quaeritorhiza haematococci]
MSLFVVELTGGGGGGGSFGGAFNTSRLGPASGGGGFGGGRPQSAGGNVPQPQQKNVPPDQKLVQKDMQQERPLWRFSVYSHGKEEPNLIIGTDWSQEESRWTFESQRRTTGNIQPYLQECHQRMQHMESEIQRVVRNPDSAWRQAMSTMNTDTTNSPFGANTGGGAFNTAGPTTASSMLSSFQLPGAGAHQPTSVFGGGAGSNAASVFGGGPQQQQSVFGQPQGFGLNQTSAFGGGSAGLVFGNVGAAGSAFGAPTQNQPQQQQQPFSAFGQPQQPQTSVFGGTGGATGFGLSQQTPPQQQQPQQGRFAGFGTPPAAQQQQAGLFGGPSPSAIGVPQQPNPAPQAGPPVNLKPEEDEAFRAKAFTYGKIPEVEPPPALRQLVL